MNGEQLIDELDELAVKDGFTRGVTDGVLLKMLRRLSHEELLNLVTSKQ